MGEQSSAPEPRGLVIRPYQLMCMVCSIGEGRPQQDSARVREVLKAIRQDPDVPVTLRCNVGDVFAFQDPGNEDDTPEGAEFNRRRDLEILMRLDLVPGATLPARILLHRLWDRVECTSGVCGYDEVTSEAWAGCPKAAAGFYEKGREMCLAFAVPNCVSQTGFGSADLPKAGHVPIVPRTREDRAEAKRKALEAMYEADAVAVRPHNVIDAVDQYGGGHGPGSVEDNLPELIQLIISKPDTKLELVDRAPWMTCAPCPSWVPGTEACLNVKGYGGMTNQYRDVRMLQRLGMRFGDVISAREFLRLVFERAHPATFYHWNSKPGSLWHDGQPDPDRPYSSYEKGMAKLKKELGLTD